VPSRLQSVNCNVYTADFRAVPRCTLYAYGISTPFVSQKPCAASPDAHLPAKSTHRSRWQQGVYPAHEGTITGPGIFVKPPIRLCSPTVTNAPVGSHEARLKSRPGPAGN
jgi:hypothetical protein